MSRVSEGDPEAAAEARQMPTDDLLRRARLIDSEVRVLKVRWLLPGVVPLPRASCPNPHLSVGRAFRRSHPPTAESNAPCSR